MLRPGDAFERYIIETLIGQGGMGSVYRAYDPRLGRRVALKVISEPSAASVAPAASNQSALEAANARLVREARAAAAFDHPNAVAIFDVGEFEGAPYIVMELVEGRTLRRAPGEVALPVATRVLQLAGVARALAAAHRRGLVHRDIKPENVMVREDGTIKVVDFGIAGRVGGSAEPRSATQPALPTLSTEGVKLGTPVYMAPEQIRGDALDGRTDQFAWGVLAYELLAGELPWRGGDDVLAVMASVLVDPVDVAPLERARVPLAVSRVILRALHKQPASRFTSMDELLATLESTEQSDLVLDSAPAAKAQAEAGIGATLQQRFSTTEVREVLGNAIEHHAAKQKSTQLGFDDLLAVAAEVGVDVESLREASRALRNRTQGNDAELANRVESDAWLRQRKLAFYRHAGIYAIVNAAILVLGLVLLSFTPWWIWFLPALGWSVGVAIHGLIAFTSNEQDFAEHKQGMQWWLESHRKVHELPAAEPEAHSPGRARGRHSHGDNLRRR